MKAGPPTLRRAIVRPPGPSYAEGLTTAGLGPPDLERALAQHAAYCDALERLGLALIRLDPDPFHPDSTFVEDAAVLTPRGAVLTLPGAPSRRGEIAGIRPAIEPFFPAPREIAAPGTLDGGDVCDAGDRVFVGVSSRTNAEGARQLAAILGGWGIPVTGVDIRGAAALLHLKSGLASLGPGLLAVDSTLADHPAFRAYDLVRVSEVERYAANCVRVNEAVLVAEGFPEFAAALAARGLAVQPIAMSEFEKMDGGLSCLSLRF
ncbi:MAG TPA: N(G),N(G)-dimethylarginine dimethylaminohydrolase [Candidatus Eisenbacteria bacterium]